MLHIFLNVFQINQYFVSRQTSILIEKLYLFKAELAVHMLILSSIDKSTVFFILLYLILIMYISVFKFDKLNVDYFPLGICPNIRGILIRRNLCRRGDLTFSSFLLDFHTLWYYENKYMHISRSVCLTYCWTNLALIFSESTSPPKKWGKHILHFFRDEAPALDSIMIELLFWLSQRFFKLVFS